jgi:hypothetical protein
MTEEVQVTSLSTYLPVTLRGGSSKMMGGCKKIITLLVYATYHSVEWHKVFLNMIQTYFQQKWFHSHSV